MSNFTKAFEAVNELLLNTKSLWQIVAFDYLDIPWAEQYPRLFSYVQQLSEENIDALDVNHDKLVDMLLPLLNSDLDGLTVDSDLLKTRPTIVENYKYPAITADISRLSAGIKGRKWQQITQFSRFITAKQHAENLEWCSGKGHLGRLVARMTNKPVTSLEWQKALCEQGELLSHKHNVNQTFVNADAFEDGQALLNSQQHAFALHACGDLHVELLKQGVKAQTPYLTIAPCCYHLIVNDRYQPLSNLAKKSRLTLSKYDLRLPLQHSMIANNKQNQRRNKEVHWRLSFDALQRELFSNPNYLPLPTIKQSQLNDTFENFSLWACEAKCLTLNTEVDFEKYLRIGKQRQRVAKQLDLVRHLFRYALEMWLIYDRSLFLESCGYEVSLSTFCNMSVTPRNLLIDAKKITKY